MLYRKMQRFISAVLFAILSSSSMYSNNESAPDNPINIAYSVFQAYKYFYPQSVKQIKYRNNDWAVKINETWYYWAESRIIPEESLSEMEKFRKNNFYYYPINLAKMPILTGIAEQEFLANLEKQEAQEKTLTAHNGFLQEIYGGHSPEEIEKQLVSFDFLGKPVRVHEFLEKKLKRIEENLRKLEKNDPKLRQFLANIVSVSGYKWREMSFFKKLSYHSFGMALDLIPESWEKAPYWFWARRKAKDWYNIEYSERFEVPASLILAFEREGFLWGGKWLFFDNMHFEYRPEILLLRSTIHNYKLLKQDKLINDN